MLMQPRTDASRGTFKLKEEAVQVQVYLSGS